MKEHKIISFTSHKHKYKVKLLKLHKIHAKKIKSEEISVPPNYNKPPFIKSLPDFKVIWIEISLRMSGGISWVSMLSVLIEIIGLGNLRTLHNYPCSECFQNIFHKLLSGKILCFEWLTLQRAWTELLFFSVIKGIIFDSVFLFIVLCRASFIFLLCLTCAFPSYQI